MADTNRLNVLNISSVAFWCFAFSVAFVPVGLGGNRAVPLGIAQTGFAASCLLLAFSGDMWSKVRFFTRVRWIMGLLALVVLWAVFQIQPVVPVGWAHPLWQETAAVVKSAVQGSISVSPEDGLKGLTRLLTYIAVGLLAYVLAQDTRRARQLLELLWLSGSIICVYGLILHIVGLQRILWLEKWAYKDDLTATFVNHNHFAIYAGMVLITGAALFQYSLREALRAAKPHERVECVRNWLVRRGLLSAFLLAVVMVSIVLSHSRAGLAMSLAGLGAYFFFYQLYRRNWRAALLIALGTVVVIGAAAAVAVATSERFANLFTDYSSRDRMTVYRLGWRALLDNPWLGYGLNGFEPEFRLYQQNMVMEFNHAHNDWLESLMDLGIPGGLALWAALALVMSGLVHGLRRRRRDGMFPALALAAGLMVLGHALVDFSLQVPGVAVTWAMLLGTGLAQSWGQSERQKNSRRAVAAA